MRYCNHHVRTKKREKDKREKSLPAIDISFHTVHTVHADELKGENETTGTFSVHSHLSKHLADPPEKRSLTLCHSDSHDSEAECEKERERERRSA